jgi:hypothetical protein
VHILATSERALNALLCHNTRVWQPEHASCVFSTSRLRI